MKTATKTCFVGVHVSKSSLDVYRGDTRAFSNGGYEKLLLNAFHHFELEAYYAHLKSKESKAAIVACMRKLLSIMNMYVIIDAPSTRLSLHRLVLTRACLRFTEHYKFTKSHFGHYSPCLKKSRGFEGWSPSVLDSTGRNSEIFFRI